MPSQRQRLLAALGIRGSPEGLTKELIDKVLRVPVARRYAIGDDRVPGFFLRCGAARAGPKGPRPGPAMFWVQTRVDKKMKQVKVGPVGVMTLDEARALARQKLAKLHSGIDLNAEKRAREVEERSRVSLQTYIDEGYAGHLDAMKSGKSEKQRLLKAWKPLLDYRLDEITEAEINRVLLDRREAEIGDGTVRRDWSALQALLRYAWRKQALAALPFRGRPEALEGTMDGERDRFLGQRSADEVATFQRVLAGEMHEVRTAVLLLLATGMRRGELLDLRREQVNWKEGIVVIPKEKTKSGRKTGDRRVYLSPDALELLRSLKKDDKVEKISGPFFPPPTATWETRLARCKNRWKAAGVKDLTLHDLRRSFATMAFASGARLEAVSKLLGHSKVHVTQRYAELVDAELHQAAAGVRVSVTPGA